jgi:hypothetical protein
MIQRRFRSAVPLLIAAALAGAATGQAATFFGVRAGEYTEAGDPFVGLEINTQLRDSIWLNPNLEYVFLDDGDLATLNFDMHYDFDVPAPLLVWAGAGPALVYSKRDLPRGRSDSETDIGLNLLGGVGWEAGNLVPYFQAKALISDDNEFVVAFGLRF